MQRPDLTYWTAVLFCVALAGTSRADSQAPVITGRTMGTTYRIVYWGDGQAAPKEIQAAVDQLLETFDQQMSTYRPDSELSRFNQAPADKWFPVSADTAKVVAAAIDYHRQTGGALDVTIGPVLRLWHFGPGSGRDRPDALPPSDRELEIALRLVGAERLEVRADVPALRKSLAGVEVELSSIAPGYAVDLAIELLLNCGFANAMVEIGGEVRAAGVRPDGEPWRIGVESPGGEGAGRAPRRHGRGGSLARVVPLANLALSTAGDYRILRAAGGVRYSHIIDPRTGRALPSRGASVTVLAATCLEADALDTPLLVMGAEAGYDWCVEHDVAAMFQERDETTGEVMARTTPRFDELVPE